MPRGFSLLDDQNFNPLTHKRTSTYKQVRLCVCLYVYVRLFLCVRALVFMRASLLVCMYV